MDHNYVIGLDYGTDSVRAVVVDGENGKTAGQAVAGYPRWAKGAYCDPAKSRFRQHPLDYIETLGQVVKEALAASPAGTAEKVRGISVDTTGSTPVFADETGTPLSLSPEFAENPNAQFILWKDHTSVSEAEEINKTARAWKGLDPTTFVGGIYSSEWFWAKALHVIREDPKMAEGAFTLIEHCDWIPALLTGEKNPANIKRSRCAAGHKALWHRDFGGFPPVKFFAQLHPKLADIWHTLGAETYTSDAAAGIITPEWAERLGLPEGCVIGVGAFDAHMGAVGAGIKAFQLAKVMGTSTCDMIVVPPESAGDRVVRGICGQVDGSIVPGLVGYEAGQSAFGDAYAWFKNLLLWPVKMADDTGVPGISDRTALVAHLEKTLIPEIERLAADIDPEESGIIALDWLNGRRTPDADQSLRGGFMGLNLGSDPVRMHRAMIEATAFGSKAIIERFREEGVTITEVIALGGVSQKASLVMQIVADVLNMEIRISAAEQACALGAAMFAAAAAGLYEDLPAAQEKMSAGFSLVYKPDPKMVKKYEVLYERYKAIGKFEEELRRRSN